MIPIKVIQGTTGDIDFQLHVDGTPANLTGHSIEAVIRDGSGAVSSGLSSGTLTDPVNGKVTMNLAATILAGAYKLRFKVTDSGGKVHFFPSAEPLLLEVAQ